MLLLLNGDYIMNDKRKKLTSKKKLIITAIVLAAAVILGFTIFSLAKPDESKAIHVVEVARGDITENLETSCTVVSANQGLFDIVDGTYVKKVNVRVGDEVKKGDLLATFDTSSLNNLIAQKQSEYDEAKKAYLKYEGTAKDATGELEKLSKQIASLEKQIKELSKKVGNSANNVPSSPEAVDLIERLTQILGDKSLASQIINNIVASSTSIQKTVELLEDILNGANVQISNITAMLNGSDEAKDLISKQLELIKLKIKKSTLQIQSELTLENMYFSVMESAKKDLEDTKAAIQALNRGWVAEFDGIVREVNIKEGSKYEASKASGPSVSNIDISSVLSSLTSSTPDFAGIIGQLFPDKPKGMIVEYYPLEATFEIGKSDYFKLFINQPVKIISASESEFEGHVSYINPLAKEGGININSVLGSGATGSIMEGRVTIDNPDKSVIIGLDMDLCIKLDTQKDAVLVPVESIQNAEDGTYVYIYNEQDKKIKKSYVKTGLFDGSYYEVLSGCEEGDLIVKLPVSDMEDGQKIYAKKVG